MKTFRWLLPFLLISAPALAQWQVPNNAVPIGRGAGVSGFQNVPMASGSLLIGQSGIPQAIVPTGDVTISAPGVTAIGTAKVTYAMMQNVAALSVVGRSANSSGVPGAISCVAASDAVLRESGSVLGCGTIATAGIANSAVTNAKMATMADGTIKSNISGGSAVPSDNTITAVLDKLGSTQGQILYRNATTWVPLAVGTAGQFLTTQGAAANPTWSSGGAGTGTVTQVICGTGLDGGTITASGTCSLSAARRTLPTVCAGFAGAVCPTSGSAQTYTTPANVLWIEVDYTGGGGGGAGASTTTIVAGTDGTKSTFNSIDASPGKGAAAVAASGNAGGAGGTGGTGTATFRDPGSPGGGATNANPNVATTSGFGGSSYCGGGAVGIAGVAVGITAPANSGAGGSGAANGGVNFQTGGGGGGGEHVKLIIGSPSATYTWTLGPGGAGGSSTSNGGAGATGCMRVIEHYGT